MSRLWHERQSDRYVPIVAVLEHAIRARDVPVFKLDTSVEVNALPLDG